MQDHNALEEVIHELDRWDYYRTINARREKERCLDVSQRKPIVDKSWSSD
jgi:hypothetical protein